jgi:hemerythrin superfamily protein
LAPQLGTTCHEYYNCLPKIQKDQKANLKYPSKHNNNPVYIKEGNITFEYEAKIDFIRLNELITDRNVQELNISTVHPIFLEIKKFFEIILVNDQSVMDGWKYRDTFISIYKDHHDHNGNKKLQFVQMDWINSFVTSFIFYLYH